MIPIPTLVAYYWRNVVPKQTVLPEDIPEYANYDDAVNALYELGE